MTLHPYASTDYIVPYYIGGPMDGCFGPIEPRSDTLGTIRRAGGSYSLQGFCLSSEEVEDSMLATVTPDRAVYLWEVAR